MTAARVLVTDASRASALAVIRSLGRAGHTVIAADTAASTVGGSSRYASDHGRYPSPDTDGVAATAGAISDLARRHRVDLVIPITDDVIVPLLHTGVELPEGTTLAVADPVAYETAASKIATTRLARSLGVAVPEDEVVHDPSEARGITARLGTPVVVKPDRSRIVDADGRLRRGPVRYAWTDAEAVAAAEDAGQPVLLQRHHAGTGHGIGMVLAAGRPVAAVAHRRLHEVPVSGGASARRETVDLDPVMRHQAESLLGALAWTGAAMVEFKVGAEGTSLMEVNGRLWGSMPLAVRAGCDIPGHLLAVHLGTEPVTPAEVDTRYESGTRGRNLDLELLWIGSVLARGRRSSGLVEVTRRDGLTAALDLVRSGQGDDLHADDDRRPMVAGVRQAVGHAARKAVRR